MLHRTCGFDNFKRTNPNYKKYYPLFITLICLKTKRLNLYLIKTIIYNLCEPTFFNIKLHNKIVYIIFSNINKSQTNTKILVYDYILIRQIKLKSAPNKILFIN